MAEVTNTPDIENMPLAELRKLAEEEARQAAEQETETPVEAAQVEQPRDEKGRFTKADEQPPTVEAADEPEQKIYRRVIDLGGEAGAEVFEAETLEQLVDKIADAKMHASKKIRDQETELRNLRAKQQQEQQQATADEEFIYSQELLAKPTEAFKKLFKQTTGVDIQEFKTVHERANAIVEAQDKQTVINNFLTTHPDYVDSPKNGELMQKWMSGVITTESFNKAYQDLKAKGFLDLKGEEAHSGTEPNAETTERIAQPKQETTPPRTKKASGVSTHSRPAAPTNPEPSEDDLYKLPLDEIRRRADAQLAKLR